VTVAPPSIEELTVQVSREALEAINELAQGLRFHMTETGDHAQSLSLIAEFFAKAEYFDIAEYIGRIALAFYDHADGIKDPIFSRHEKNKGDPTQKWRGRMWAALGFECLLKTKMSQPKAADHIVRKYPELRRLLRGNRQLNTSLRGWHVEFTTNGLTPPRAQLKAFAQTYKRLGLGSQLAKAEYQQRAKDCLSMAKTIAARLPSEP
jgi:hypothetical protein